ncbi:TetR/AcrR family transcriptional regulator [Streptomyces cylindrosporus]|uniref:TetR family transcriptional regulator n=1 Tax=Streptomyces cylindrosporus TaxID=2927583 RepID=A0ABS9Y8R6_9ACTN|nr:TetR/AcrR family transcriptional regulator [Streptomyces cylindrosporus]MCI3273630.1 TetR family transcriptional regulator [Streptomyces cylindrosporus]
MTERRRQQDRTRATRQVLISTARRLFAQRGFAAVPAEEIVAEAGLTRGALRHHFGDKRELFRAVFEEQERDITDRVAAALADADGSWSAATKGLSAFLDACEDPEVIRIALTDAPAVLGWAEWRAIEARHGLGLVIAGLDQAMAEGILVRQPADVVGHLLLSAAIEAALLIAQAPDPRAARVEAEQALLALLGGLRTPSE